MRLTIRLDDEVYAAAQAMAADEGIGVGQAVNELARAGMPRQSGPIDYVPMSDSMGMKVDCLKVSELLEMEDLEKFGGQDDRRR